MAIVHCSLCQCNFVEVKIQKWMTPQMSAFDLSLNIRLLTNYAVFSPWREQEVLPVYTESNRETETTDNYSRRVSADVARVEGMSQLINMVLRS